MSEAACPLPTPLDPQAAQKKLAEIQKRRSALSPAAQERFAAKEMGVDVPTFRAALKGKPVLPNTTTTATKAATKAKTPITADPQKTAYDAGWNASKTTKTYDIDAAEQRFMAKHGTTNQDDFIAGWTDHASDYEKYTSIKPKPKPVPASHAGVPELSAKQEASIREAMRSGSFPKEFEDQVLTALSWSDDLTHDIVANLTSISTVSADGTFALASGTRLLINTRIFTKEFEAYWLRAGTKVTGKNWRHLLNQADAPAHVPVIQHELGHFLADKTSSAAKYRAFTALAEDLGIPRPPVPRTFDPYMTDIDKWLKLKSVKTRIYNVMGSYPTANSEELFAELWRLYSIDRDNAPSWVLAWAKAIRS